MVTFAAQICCFMKVEEKYEDVLQNIELCVVGHYHNNPDFKDYDTNLVYEALYAYYRRESVGLPQKPHLLNESRKQLFDDIKDVLQFRLDIVVSEGIEINGGENPNEVYVLCFKRLIQSVKLWSTRGVRGYLDFVKKYV